MNSRGISKYLVSGIFIGVLLAAILLAHILYVPEKVPSDNLAKSKQTVKKQEALAGSKRPSASIDTVYMYDRQEPLIVYANTQPLAEKPSLAETEEGKDEDEDFVDKDAMEAFEQAFNNVIEQEKKMNEAQISENTEAANRSVDHGIMSEGMILDETQTRMGGTFFTYFYNHWQAPQAASNFMITINEKIMPSIGTSISVKIDEELVFQTRLQPRYDYIEQMGQRAVAICYQRLQQTSNSEYYQVY